MTRDEALELVRQRIAEVMDIDPSTIDEDTRMEEDLEADSLDLVELAMALEEHIESELPDEDLGTIVTVGDAVDLVLAQVGATADAPVEE